MRYAFRFSTVLAVLAIHSITSSPASAQAQLGLQLARDCNRELAAHCAGVTVGGGRKVACLFAYNDRLSVRCALTLHKATVFAEESMSALRQVVQRCGADINRHCADIIPGQGRIAICLRANHKVLSRGCRHALASPGANR